MLRPRHLLVALAATTVLAAAQTTHTVGPGGFAQISAALAVAAPGDTIVVHPGNYGSFTASVGVTIRAITSGTVFVQLSSVNCPAPQQVHLLGLDTVDLTVQGATCTLDDCRVLHGLAQIPALRATNARVFLQNCVLGSAGAAVVPAQAPGLLASGSTVVAVETSFQGRSRDLQFGLVSPGASLSNSTLHGSRCTFFAGDGLSTGVFSVAPGVVASNSPVWLTDSTLRGSRATDLPGLPVVGCSTNATTGRLSRCTLLPATCTPAIATNGSGVGVHRSAPWQANATFGLDVRAAANTFVAVFGSNDVDVFSISLFEQPGLLGLATLVPITLLLTDGNGDANVAWTLPPGTGGLSLWLQVLADGNAPLQTSPVVGGIVRP